MHPTRNMKNQENMAQSKEQKKSPLTNPKMENYEMFDSKFLKNIILKALSCKRKQIEN